MSADLPPDLPAASLARSAPASTEGLPKGLSGPPGPRLGALHLRRLREVWRSAGWPCRDGIEAELLLAGWLLGERDAAGRETLQLTPAGLAQLVAHGERHRRARGAHEALVERVASAMQRAGRIVWRGLSLRAPPGEQATKRDWPMAMPDVYSIRHTTREDAVEPVAHEIKVRRGDLLADLRRPAKGEAYRALSSQCWYVLAAGIGGPDDIPPVFGVMLADSSGLHVARPAPRRPFRLPLQVWMALARSNALPLLEAEAQGWLGAPDGCVAAERQAGDQDQAR
jgi:hypothetical protein